MSEPIELIPATDGKGGYSPEFLAALRGEAAATPDDSTAPDPVTAGHDGPCIYAEPEQASVSGPVCGSCKARIISAEVAADPYYKGDYYAMFGDDE